MSCKVCGDENAKWHAPSRQSLCDFCAEDTPGKVSFDEFCAAYFPGDSDCPTAIKRDFFDDYRCSKHDLETYMAKTISETF